ncbi:Bug family tripartite tricarboxylate transporter substrate binding protein [Xylophilus sp. ASV27]|uniref:Bug family tripartite tricarboxylate transporter substrate binding protein n=1 Tax=Xylophilus sp. ASV27 TaxID=2795129 RepID=UPI001E59240F|nr:tripartite tricarboxylate transporter substrate binding protein [Xylophilus sp. ASV27]
MKMNLKTAWRVAATAVSLMVGMALPAHAAYPERAVTVVVPFAPGQTGDIIARLVAKELQGRLGQAFIVDNRPGTGGRLGTATVARAKPDGYTLLLTSSGPFAIAPALYARTMTYDPVRDFVGIAELASTPQVILVSNQSGVTSLPALVKEALAKDLSYGSAGNGSLQHLTMELLKKELQFPMVHVPFKGSSESKTALIGGQIDASADSLPAVIGSVKSGQIKAVAVVDTRRSEYLPEVPTLTEAGFPAQSAVAFFGLVAPKGVSQEIVRLLHKEATSLIKSPAFQEQMRKQALTLPEERTPEQFDAYLSQEVARWRKVVQEAQVSAE